MSIWGKQSHLAFLVKREKANVAGEKGKVVQEEPREVDWGHIM